jgi:non-specific serine/threonine protein kinase
MILQCSFGITLILTRGMNDTARRALTRALTLAREYADFDYQQRATHNLWLFSARASALDDALAIAREYEAVARLGDVQARAVADCWLGTTLIYRGAHSQAIKRLQSAIDHYPMESRTRDMIRFGGDTRASSAGHIAVSLLSRGLLDTASKSAISAVDQASSTNQPAVLCVALAWAAGFIFLSLGDLETAERYGNELLDHALKHALRPFYAVGLCVRGSLAARRGDAASGVDPLRHGLTEMREASYQLFYPFFLVELAAALGALGRIDEGLAEIDAALRFAAGTGHRWYEPETLRLNGQLLGLRDPDDPAVEDCFHRGSEIAREQDALFWELRLALSLARLRASRGRLDTAQQILAPVCDRFVEGFGTPDFRAARAMLDTKPSV